MAAVIYHRVPRFVVFFFPFLKPHLPIDKIDGLSFELLGAVQVGEDERVGYVLHTQAAAQRLLAHHL